MHPDRDFDGDQPLPKQADSLTQDLELGTLWDAMAGGQEFLRDVARKATLLSIGNDAATVVHRQQVLTDALAHAAEVRELYALAVEAIDGRRKHWFGILMNYPSSVLSSSVELLQFFMGMLQRLRGFAQRHGEAFESPGFRSLFAMLQAEFDDDYFAVLQRHLKTLKFPAGVVISAKLGRGAEGVGYVLRRPHEKPPFWHRLVQRSPPGFSFRLHERDEAGARALGDLRDRGINLVANALGQSCEHVLSFFTMLRTELAFCVACLNLHEKLAGAGAPHCFPAMAEPGSSRLRCTDLRDACLVLKMGRAVVGNTVDANDRDLVVITGANQGGKSSFLRAVGVAQLMMQTGMFVCAETFAGERGTGLFTHYNREEDATLRSGKLDEELCRLSSVADEIRPGGLLLANESFASTNEREGSEIARQTVHALRERRIKVLFVTHLYEFAATLAAEHRTDALFLRAQRRDDGTRTFKLEVGEALSTSFGKDLYAEVFGDAAQTP